MADRELKPEKIDHTGVVTGEPLEPEVLAWEPPGGFVRRPVRRGAFRPRRPRL